MCAHLRHGSPLGRGGSVGIGVGSGGSVRLGVGLADGVGDAVGVAVGEGVGVGVGAAVGDAVGEGVGEEVGATVGEGVGGNVGAAVGAEVGAAACVGMGPTDGTVLRGSDVALGEAGAPDVGDAGVAGLPIGVTNGDAVGPSEASACAGRSPR